MIRKIRYLSPMELFRKSDQKIKFRSKPKKVKKMTIIQLSIRYFKVRIRKLVMIVLMMQLQSRYFYQLIYMLHNIRHSLERLMGKCQRIMIMNFLRIKN